MREEQKEGNGKEEVGPTIFTAHEQPMKAMMGNKAVMEAFESATANSLHTTEIIKATMTEACTTAIQLQVLRRCTPQS